jgi:hypothetical protein
MSFCAFFAVRWTGKGSLWKALVPGSAAAVSLIPYAGVLRKVGEWAPLVQQRVDWIRFCERYLDWKAIFFIAAWSLLVLWAIRRSRRSISRSGDAGSTCLSYCALAVAVLFAAQIAAIEFQRVPPFPRYFLQSLLPAALAIDVLTRGLRVRMALAALSFVLLAIPSWSILRLQRTNMDIVGSVLAKEAEPRDLIVVSPWFLHTSFQRYYRGETEWVTVPVLPRATIMRYDLIGAAIVNPDSEAALSRCIEKASSRGGHVWLLTQRRFRSDPGTRIPLRPGLSSTPRGEDYVRFRSYWEEGIEYRLRACCTGVERLPVQKRAVWDEEDLILIRWSPKSR